MAIKLETLQKYAQEYAQRLRVKDLVGVFLGCPNEEQISFDKAHCHADGALRGRI